MKMLILCVFLWHPFFLSFFLNALLFRPKKCRVVTSQNRNFLKNRWSKVHTKKYNRWYKTTGALGLWTSLIKSASISSSTLLQWSTTPLVDIHKSVSTLQCVHSFTASLTPLWWSRACSQGSLTPSLRSIIFIREFYKGHATQKLRRSSKRPKRNSYTNIRKVLSERHENWRTRNVSLKKNWIIF